MKTLKEILDERNNDIDNEWVVEGLISKKSINMLSGETSCGKTMFAIDMITAILDSKQFLGRETNKQKVLYISTEADYRSIAKRLIDSKLQNSNDLKIDCEYDTNDFNIRDKTRESDFIIVDVLADFFNSYIQDKNNYWDVYEVFSKIRKDRVLKEKTWLFIHHLNKKGDPMGTRAYDAAPDTRMIFTAPEGRMSYLRALDAYGKCVPNQEIKVSFNYPNISLMTEDEYTGQIRIERELAEIIGYITSKKEVCCSASELCNLLNLSKYGLTHISITKYLNNNINILNKNQISFEIGHNHNGRFLKLIYIGEDKETLQCDSESVTPLIDKE